MSLASLFSIRSNYFFAETVGLASTCLQQDRRAWRKTSPEPNRYFDHLVERFDSIVEPPLLFALTEQRTCRKNPAFPFTQGLAHKLLYT
jgi:hypothetical protein